MSTLSEIEALPRIFAATGKGMGNMTAATPLQAVRKLLEKRPTLRKISVYEVRDNNGYITFVIGSLGYLRWPDLSKKEALALPDLTADEIRAKIADENTRMCATMAAAEYGA